MCWSFTASIVFTSIGLLASTYLIIKKEDPYLWIPMIYFSLMELLQVFTYVYLNQCGLPINQMLTYIAYLHIAFQPFFINMIMLHFIPKEFRDKIKGYVFAICFAATILMLIKVYPFAWAEPCKAGISSMCGQSLCSMSGNLHLAWFLPLSDFGAIFGYAYPFTMLILPLIYGAWRMSVYFFITGPFLVKFLTNNPNEFPAVWCLFSVAILIIILIPPLKRQFKAKKWYFWKYPKW